MSEKTAGVATAETRYEWTVEGMDCASCVAKARGAVERVSGVSGVEVSLMKERLRVSLDEARTRPEAVERAIGAIGYKTSARRRLDPEGAGEDASGREAEDHGACGCGGHDHRNDNRNDNGHGGHKDGDHKHGDSHSHAHDHDDPSERGQSWWRTGKGRLVILTGALLAAAWATELLVSPGISRWAFVAACLIGLFPVARRAFALLRAGMPFTIEMLMTIAATGALFIDASEEAALVVFLFAVGELLEGVATDQARSGIRSLVKLLPKTALLLESGRPREVPADSLAVGNEVLVRPGDRVPADGTVVAGSSGVDESPVTGESMPQTRSPGDDVFAGSINAEAALTIRVTREPSDNTIARIIRLVEEAEEARAPTERYIDRLSRVYMPFIVGIAVLVALVPPLALGLPWDVWIYRALALLLIGCPCALVISVPAAIASGLSSGARRGLLMKGGSVVEAAAATRLVAFDKTGTLTQGRPVVTDIVPFGSTPQAEVLMLAAAVENGSSHPLAKAILIRAENDGLALPAASAARALPGRGVVAELAGRGEIHVTSPAQALEAGRLPDDLEREASALENAGKTVVVVHGAEGPIGLVAMRDEPREDAARAIRELARLDVSAVMLTGDNARTAAAIGDVIGIEQRARLLPEDKLVAIRELSQGGPVMMVGDGINDAPALKQASLGVAMGSGTDVALETADAAILRDRVGDVAAMIRLARATMSNIHQNVAIALGLKGVFLVTSVLGITGLWIAILADTGATVLVTANALRLLAYDPVRAGGQSGT
ncbi:heavy metal translocating P-type ATPase [Stappia sp.]|uniref:heavy metal translocating P-type ATPase n=1 Tax=Stappia sp. TaxID=1870903 RepID=UPI003D0DDB70